jgi:long-chain acyl-CoA synthetase
MASLPSDIRPSWPASPWGKTGEVEEFASERQWHTPPRFVVSPEVNAADDVFDNAKRRPDHEAFARKVNGTWQPVTAKGFAEEVTALAAGLIAAGIGPGDRIGLMSGTRYEWMLCDFAIWSAGAVTVPIYETSSTEQVGWILRDSAAVAVFVENERYADVVAQAVGGASVPTLWRMDTDLDRLSASGPALPSGLVGQRRRVVRADSLATIVYTSGTTGRPKGCMISHGNLVAEVRNTCLADGISDVVLTEQTRVLLFLPLAHVLARLVGLGAVHNGAQVACTSDIANLPAELASYQPTLVLAVPRVFEKLYNIALRTAEAAGHARLFRAAERTAIAYSQSLDEGGPGWWLRSKHRLFDRLVYGKLRAAMGGRVTHACSGGAPLGARLGHFFRGAGVTILEGWGLTETTAGVTLNLPDNQRIGSVGQPLPGCTVRIAASGEVLTKGPNTFAGYWHNEPATRAAFDSDRWFHTGDLGQLHDGYLTITGRQKDLIITSGGKNVAPAMLEDRLRAHWLIDECVLVGDGRPYIGALISLDSQQFAAWAREHHKSPGAAIAALRDDADLRSTLQAAIDEANRTVSAAEAIKRFRIVAKPFTVGAELTPTQKVRRNYVFAKFASDIEALYASVPDEQRGLPRNKGPRAVNAGGGGGVI